ncbi:MAG: sialidase family protein [Candidatus Thermoplasmatota archaeon]|nr:sialidase family protein [Candidatus Thermoplasmatota archaeon]
MSSAKIRNMAIVVVAVAMMCAPAVTSLSVNEKENTLIATTTMEKATIVFPANDGNSMIGYMGNVQISSGTTDEEHPTIVKAPDGSFLVAYDCRLSGIEGHVYFMRSTDNGNTWSEIWNTNVDIGEMKNGVQTWPVLCTPPGGQAIYGSWNDEALDIIFFINISNPSDPGSYGEKIYGYDASGWDYERHTFTIAAFDENRFAVGHVGHIEFGGYDLPSSCQICCFTGGFSGGFGITGDEDYPIGYNNEVAVTSSLFWMIWDFPNEASGTSDLLLKWGDPGEESDCHLWPDKEITSNKDYVDPALDASGDNLCIVYMTNDNIYGDWDLACKYSTDEGGTWHDGTFPSMAQADEKSPEIFVSGSTVFCTFVRNGNLYLTKSTDLGQMWEEPEQINEVDGTVVDEEGAVEVSPAGIVWVDTRNGNKDIYYAPLPCAIINVNSISGGMGISATITNTGTEDASNMDWSIELTGLIFIGKETTGTIDSLPAGGEEAIKSGLVFGIGPTTITITAGGASKTAKGFVLGPLVLGVK